MAHSDLNHLKLASAGDDVKIWESSNFQLAHHFNSHLAPSFRNVHWSSDFQQLVSVPSSGSTLLFTLVKSQSLQHLEVDTKVVNTVARFSATSSRFMGIGTKTGDILVWDMKYTKPKKSFKCPGEITCLQFNWNDSYVASGSVDGSIILHNVTTGQSSSPLQAPSVQGIRDLRYSFYRKGLIGCASDDGTVALWDANVRQMYHSFPCSHNAPATGLAFSPANALLLTSIGLDKKVICYDIQSNRIVKALVCESPLTSVDFKEDGYTIAAGSSRGKIYIYDLRSPSMPVHALSAHCSSVQSLVFQNSVVASTLKKDPVKAGHNKADLNTALCIKPKKGTRENAVSNIDSEVFSVKQVQSVILPQLQEAKKNLASEFFTPVMSALKKNPGGDAAQLQEVKRDSLTDEIFSPVRDLTVVKEPFRPKISPLTRTVPTSPGLQSEHENLLDADNVHLSRNQNSSLGDLFSPVQDGEETISSLRHITVRGDQNAASPVLCSRTAETNSENYESNQFSIPSKTPEPINTLDTCAKYEPFPFEFADSTALSPKIYDANASTMACQMNEPETTEVSNSSRHATEIPQAMEVEAIPEIFMEENKFGEFFPDFNKDNTSDPLIDEGRGFSEPVTPLAPQAFQAEFIRQIVEDAMDECRQEFRQTFLHYYTQMIRQFEKQKAEIGTLLQRHSINDQLISEIERLKEENKLLRSTF